MRKDFSRFRPVISDAQHSFVKGRSTVSNLVQFTNGVIGEIEDGWQVHGVYTDFSKAFDRVLHVLFEFNLSILFGGSLPVKPGVLFVR
jgi:hypothetical protein